MHQLVQPEQVRPVWRVYRLNNDYSQYLMELSINWFNQNRCIRFVGFHLLNNIIQFQYLWKLYINWFNKNRCVRFVGFHLLNNIISSSCGSYTSTGSTRTGVSGFSGFIFSTTLFPVLLRSYASTGSTRIGGIRFVGFHLFNNIISSPCGSYTSTGSTRIGESSLTLCFSKFTFLLHYLP